MRKAAFGKIVTAALLTAALVLTAGCGAIPVPDDKAAGSQDSPEESAVSDKTLPEKKPADEGEQTAESVPEEQEEAVDEGVPENGVYHPVVTGKYVDHFFPENYRTILSYHYDTVSLSEEDAVRNPELDQALTAFYDEREAEFIAEAESYYEDGRGFAENQADDYYGPYVNLQYEAMVQRSDPSVFSVMHDGDGYLGGAHGYYNQYYYNFDGTTGELLTLDQVFTDIAALPQMICDELNNKYDAACFYDGAVTPEGIAPYIEEERLVFGLTYTGVRILFNPYELGPYAAGMFDVTVPYEKYPGLLNEAYTVLPEGYIGRLPEEAHFQLDLDGSGPVAVDCETVVDYYDTWEQVSQLYINVDGSNNSFEIDSYRLDNYLVCDEGRYYIYAVRFGDNDYRSLYVFELTPEGPVQRNVEYGESMTPAESYNYDDSEDEEGTTHSVWQTQVLSDPKKMRLSTNTDVLSTRIGANWYRTGVQGVPESLDGKKYYSFDESEWSLTVKQAVSGQEVDENGSVVGEVTLEPGTEAMYIGSDGVSIADIRTTDGKIVRLEVDCSDWPHTIDGTDIQEIFDGIVFAG